MNKQILQLLIGGGGLVSVIIIAILLVQKKIDGVTFGIFFIAAVLLVIIFNILINHIKLTNSVQIKEEKFDYVQIKQDLKEYVMSNKFIQPINEQVKFHTYNKELYAVYYCEDDNSHRNFYIVYNISKRWYSEFNNKKELLLYLTELAKSQYVVKQKTIGRNTFTGEEREVEESIDKEEMKELMDLKKKREEENKLQ